MLHFKVERIAASVGARANGIPAYEAAIHEQARQGYGLVQIFIENPAAVPLEYVLIFKRERPG